MILCDREIQAAIVHRRLFIEPQPAAKDYDSTTVDLHLDAVLDKWKFDEPNPGLGSYPRFCPGVDGFSFRDIEANHTEAINISSGGYELFPVHLSTKETGPRHFILGWTAEKIYLPHTSRLCARVEGKSSLGRMGLGVHVTAPTIHAGFGINDAGGEHGTKLRLEIWNVGPLPILLVPGIRICQLILEQVREVPTAGSRSGFNIQGPQIRKNG